MSSHHDSNSKKNDASSILHGLHNVRVLCVLDDVTTRYFPFWASRSIEPKEDLAKDFDESCFNDDNIEHTVIKKSDILGC